MNNMAGAKIFSYFFLLFGFSLYLFYFTKGGELVKEIYTIPFWVVSIIISCSIFYSIFKNEKGKEFRSFIITVYRFYQVDERIKYVTALFAFLLLAVFLKNGEVLDVYGPQELFLAFDELDIKDRIAVLSPLLTFIGVMTTIVIGRGEWVRQTKIKDKNELYRLIFDNLLLIHPIIDKCVNDMRLFLSRDEKKLKRKDALSLSGYLVSSGNDIRTTACKISVVERLYHHELMDSAMYNVIPDRISELLRECERLVNKYEEELFYNFVEDELENRDDLMILLSCIFHELLEAYKKLVDCEIIYGNVMRGDVYKVKISDSIIN